MDKRANKARQIRLIRREFLFCHAFADYRPENSLMMTLLEFYFSEDDVLVINIPRGIVSRGLPAIRSVGFGKNRHKDYDRFL